MITALLQLLDDALALDGRGLRFNEDTALMGAVPEFDSMGVVAVITAMEERFGITVDDDEIDASVFATVGTLRRFIDGKLSG